MSAPYEIGFIDKAAQKEYLSFDGSMRRLVDNGLMRLRVRADEIGKPLSGKLSGCKELKFRAAGIRIIFRIVNGEIEIVEIIAIGRRDKGDVFLQAESRLEGADGVLKR